MRVQRLQLRWPGGKRFAFTVFDDTDNDVLTNVKPVYDLLFDSGMRTTKSVWVYPPRDGFRGRCLQELEYAAWIKSLESQGFEIAMHHVGSGSFHRAEIIEGLRIFEESMGTFPKIHVNHASNPDAIYWRAARFVPPVSTLYGFYRLLRGLPVDSDGHQESSQHFWGDYSKRFKYIRNFTFNGINTLNCDPLMPYMERRKLRYSNYWFSSSDGHTVEEFEDLISPRNVDQLEEEGGLCIAYTHFASGFVDPAGKVRPEIERQLRYLARKDGWFAPVSEVLDWLLAQRPTEAIASYPYLFRLNIRWALERVAKRVLRGR